MYLFQGFGDITNESTLTPGTEYTITYASHAWFQPSSDTIQAGLQSYMNDATITKVDRGFFSGRFAITFIPSVAHTLGEWQAIFNNLWNVMGYKDAAYVSIDEGAASSQGGGIAQAAVETVQTTANVAGRAIGAVASGVGKGVGAAVKGIGAGLGAPIIIGGLVIGGLYLYISSSAKAGHMPFKSNPRRYRRRKR
jgi:hypothetical protein